MCQVGYIFATFSSDIFAGEDIELVISTVRKGIEEKI